MKTVAYNRPNIKSCDPSVRIPHEIHIREDGVAIAVDPSEPDQVYEDLDALADAYELDLSVADLVDESEYDRDLEPCELGLWVSDGEGDVQVEDADPDDAEGAAYDYVDESGYPDVESTVWHKIYTWRCSATGARIDEASFKVPQDPPEPPCEGDEEHEWAAPHHIVGGLKDNPGVFGSGGGVRIHEVCEKCCTHRHTNTWAYDPEDGEEGLESVRYE